MHGFRLVRQDPSSQRVNAEIVNAHMDSEHYIRWIYPRDMETDKTASGASLGQLTLRDHWMAFPDVESPAVLWKLARPEQWLKGQVETQLHYTGGAASTANISFTLGAYLEAVGVNISSMGTAILAAESMPGPAAVNDYKIFTRSQYVPIDPSTKMISFRFQRNTADAYTGEARILSVRHRYIPSRHEL